VAERLDLDAEAVEEAIDSELTGRLKQIAATASGAPGEAFANVVAITGFLNEAVVIRASILEKIQSTSRRCGTRW
jgi:hypothetical protein